MEIIGALLISLIAGLSTVLGSILIFFKPKNINNYIGSALAFSASIMLLLSVIELIPEGFIYLEYKFNLLIAFIILLLMIFTGNLLSKIINKKINEQKKIDSSLYRVGVLSMIALMMHNLPEGILTFLSTLIDFKLGIKYGIAIMMHNIPEGIAIAIPIYYATKNKRKAIKSTLISGLSEPLGAIIAWIFISRYLNDLLLSLILLFIGGLMISISINDIFKEANKYSRKSIIIGIVLASILFVINFVLF
ncbi:MAG: ZIP family metal transporter [Bacilli bacterium]|nr:ZIP family metal transporter [Bacilli bacterium]